MAYHTSAPEGAETAGAPAPAPVPPPDHETPMPTPPAPAETPRDAPPLIVGVRLSFDEWSARHALSHFTRALVVAHAGSLVGDGDMTEEQFLAAVDAARSVPVR